MPTLSGPARPPANGEAPKKLIVLLHGYGADGNDLIGLAPMLAGSFPDAAFVSPHATFPCEMGFGHQWFSLRSYSPAAVMRGESLPIDIEDIHGSSHALNAYLDAALAQWKLTDRELALVGFSQGSMIAMHVGLRRTQPCAGIVGLSGAFLHHPKITDPLRVKPPVCLIHGDADEVVPFVAMAQSEALLKQAGVKVESYARPRLGHGIDPEGLGIATGFLKGCFQDG